MSRNTMTAGRVLIMLTIGMGAYFVVGWFLLGPKVLSPSAFMALVPMIVGLTGGVWLQRYLQKRTAAKHPRCGKCGYNLTGHDTLVGSACVCPECGAVSTDVPVIQPGEPNKRQISGFNSRLSLVSALLFTAVFLASAAAMLRRGGEFKRHMWMFAVVLVLVWLTPLAAWWRSRRNQL